MTSIYTLNQHSQGYRLSSAEAFLSPLVSTYASRHFELAKLSGKTNAERWGHRIIACIECIPILGVFVSLLERIVSIVYNWQQRGFQKKPTTQIVSSVNLLECLPGDVVGHLSKFLSVEDAGNFANVMGENDRNCIWKAQAQALQIKVPKGEKPATVIAETFAARALLNFCFHIDFCKAQIESIRKASDNIREQATALRNWLKSSPEVESCTNLDLYRADTEIDLISAIPPEICFFKNLGTLHISNKTLELKKTMDRMDVDEKNVCSYYDGHPIIYQRNDIKIIPKEIGNLKNSGSCLSIIAG
jgi:hypothetical protein